MQSQKRQNDLCSFPRQTIQYHNNPSLCPDLVTQTVKHLSTMQETRVWALVWEDPLEKEMAIHSSTIAWKIPWTEEPGRLQSMGSQRVGHDWATSLSLYFKKGKNANKIHTQKKICAVYGECVVTNQTRQKMFSGFPWWSSGKDYTLPVQRMWVQSWPEN